MGVSPSPNASKWILLASLVAWLHLMPGVHELSHRADESGQPCNAAMLSEVEHDCEACALLSARDGITDGSVLDAPPLPADSAPATLSVGCPPAASLFEPSSPRAPPTV